MGSRNIPGEKKPGQVIHFIGLPRSSPYMLWKIEPGRILGWVLW